MSTATTVAEGPVPVRGRKKLILIVAASVLLLAVAGGAAALVLKQRAAAQAAHAEEDEGAPAHDAAPGAARTVPVFVPLDPFTVNLADRNADRYAQVGITLEIDSAKTADLIKAFMPAIRNNILMAIADRSAADLLAREGKAELAERVRRETARALGYAVEMPAAAADAGAEPRKRRVAAAPDLPVKAVHFSNFIIQ